MAAAEDATEEVLRLNSELVRDCVLLGCGKTYKLFRPSLPLLFNSATRRRRAARTMPSLVLGLKRKLVRFSAFTGVGGWDLCHFKLTLENVIRRCFLSLTAVSLLVLSTLGYVHWCERLGYVRKTSGSSSDVFRAGGTRRTRRR